MTAATLAERHGPRAAGVPGSVRRARALVRAELGERHPAAEAAAVCVSELATNAILYTRSGLPGGTFAVTVQAGPGEVLVLVRDSGARTGAAPARAADEHGRGLCIVEALSGGRWGTEETRSGPGHVVRDPGPVRARPAAAVHEPPAARGARDRRDAVLAVAGGLVVAVVMHGAGTHPAGAGPAPSGAAAAAIAYARAQIGKPYALGRRPARTATTAPGWSWRPTRRPGSRSRAPARSSGPRGRTSAARDRVISCSSPAATDDGRAPGHVGLVIGPDTS